jgi:hypothetical protein
VAELFQTHSKRVKDYTNTESVKRSHAAFSDITGIPGIIRVQDMALGVGRPDKVADRRIALHCASWIYADFEV